MVSRLGLVWDAAAAAEAIGLRLQTGAAAGVVVEGAHLFLRDGRPGIHLSWLPSISARSSQVCVFPFGFSDRIFEFRLMAYGPDG